MSGSTKTEGLAEDLAHQREAAVDSPARAVTLHEKRRLVFIEGNQCTDSSQEPAKASVDAWRRLQNANLHVLLDSIDEKLVDVGLTEVNGVE